MRLLHVSHPSGFDHQTGTHHPERPARLKAVAAGLEGAHVDILAVEARPLEPGDLAVVHDSAYVEAVRRFCAAGGGSLDADTTASPGSWPAALAAAGAGPTALDHLRGSFEGPAFVGVRPPGHHALAAQAMGFCLFNNIGITAAGLRADGERVAIVDWDVHHGNGTQETFYEDPGALYVSLHQAPFYPFEGSASETGAGEGLGTTLNLPLPAFTAGDVYLDLFATIVVPAVEAFGPDWILISAGFDAHAQDPLAEMRLVETDYAAMTRSLARLVRSNRIVAFLEGGYHLPAIRDSVQAVARALVGADADLPDSPHTSPDETWRRVGRLKQLLSGQVTGLG